METLGSVVVSQQSTGDIVSCRRDTGAVEDVGPPPVSGMIFGLSDGRFVLHGDGRTYTFTIPGL